WRDTPACTRVKFQPDSGLASGRLYVEPVGDGGGPRGPGSALDVREGPRTKALGQLRLAEQAIEGGRHRGRVAGWHQQSVLLVSQHLADGRQVRRDDRQTGRHAFGELHRGREVARPPNVGPGYGRRRG